MRKDDRLDGEKAAALSFSWETIEQVIRNLAARVLTDGRPDVLVCLQRGGLIPGVLLSHRLAVSELLSVPVRRTMSDAAYAAKQAPVLVMPEHVSWLAGKDVVLVDDIVGSGETMQAVRSALAVFQPGRVRTAIALVNLAHWERAHASSPEQAFTYIGMRIRAWAVFPWERSALAGESENSNASDLSPVAQTEMERSW